MKNIFIFILNANLLIIFQLIHTTVRSQSPEFTLAFGYGFLYNDPLLRYGAHSEMKQELIGPVYFKACHMTKNYFDGDLKFGRMEHGFNLNYYHLTYHEPGYMMVSTDSSFGIIDDTWVNKINVFNIMYRLNIHLLDQTKVDPYIGIGGGLKITLLKLDPGNPGCSGEDCSYSWPYGLKYTFPLAAEAVIGMQYHITPHLSTYCELGFTKTALQVGLCTHF